MDDVIFDYYSNIKHKNIDWLWYPYIPLGKLTVIQGDPGEGKSTLVLDIVSRLTNGYSMPCSNKPLNAQVAVYQCAEDGIADTIKPRLEQAGADCSKVAYIIDNDLSLTLEDGRIETTIRETNAKLFIIDPIQAFIPPDADMQSATKMRSVMRKLARIAEAYNCAIVLIGHMNKGTGNKNLYRGLGSIDIAAIARSVLMVSRDDSNRNMRYMYPIKSSLAPEGPAVGFSFKNGGGIEWHGSYNVNTSELVDSLTINISKQDKAKAIVLNMLEDGDCLSKEIFDALSSLGIQKRTGEIIKKELGIKTYKKGDYWYWKSPTIDTGEDSDG